MAKVFDKKTAKKMSKALNLLGRQLNVQRSHKPTEWLMVWGAGQGLGTPKIVLINFFSPSPDEIRYYADKPFCTIRYESSLHAGAAKQAKNGATFPGGQVIFMDFIIQEPPPEDSYLLAPFCAPWPNGLHLLLDFISEEEEKQLLSLLYPQEEGNGTANLDGDDENIVKDSASNEEVKLKNRIVRHFGYEFRYATNDVDFNNPMPDPIPEEFSNLISKMMTYNVVHSKPEQITMNHYAPGNGLPPHVDAHSSFQQPIVSLSLGSSVVMDFRTGDQHLSLVLPPRSLLVMNDEARLLWTHGIASRKYDTVHDMSELNLGMTVVRRAVRISLTFRILNQSRICECPYPEMCDYQQATLSERTAPGIENDLVHKVYDEIAEHFSSTRHTPWPRVKEFLQKVAFGQTVLDVGCGNGKYFNVTDYIYQTGMDMSKALLKIANEKGVDGVRANCLSIPFKDNSFDTVICIAVLHHLATKERRLEALREIYRVLAPRGRALIYVWAKDQKLQEMKSVYAKSKALKQANCQQQPELTNTVPKDYSFLPVHQHEENFMFNDMLVPWLGNSGKPTVHHRFYHVFNRGELEELIGEIDASPKPRIVDSYYDQGNWCVEIRKDDVVIPQEEPLAPAAETRDDPVQSTRDPMCPPISFALPSHESSVTTVHTNSSKSLAVSPSREKVLGPTDTIASPSVPSANSLLPDPKSIQSTNAPPSPSSYSSKSVVSQSIRSSNSFPTASAYSEHSLVSLYSGDIAKNSSTSIVDLSSESSSKARIAESINSSSSTFSCKTLSHCSNSLGSHCSANSVANPMSDLLASQTQKCLPEKPAAPLSTNSICTCSTVLKPGCAKAENDPSARKEELYKS